MILFLTFCVILVTLVGQGLLLPAVIRWLALAHAGRRKRAADRAEERTARQEAIEAVIKRLDELTAERRLSEDVVRPLRALHRDHRLKHAHGTDGDNDHRKHAELHGEVELLLIRSSGIGSMSSFATASLRMRRDAASSANSICVRLSSPTSDLGTRGDRGARAGTPTARRSAPDSSFLMIWKSFLAAVRPPAYGVSPLARERKRAP